MSEPQATPDVFVLSGGAARGAVQVDMMQTLLEAGVVSHALAARRSAPSTLPSWAGGPGSTGSQRPG